MMRRLGSAIGMAAVCAASVGSAEANRLQGDFTFRRVTVPTPGSTSRITVQIAPRAPAPPPAPSAAGPDGALPQVIGRPADAGSPGIPPSGVEWFWNAVSPALSDTAPGRLELALREMANAPAGKAIQGPRLQGLQDIAKLHGRDILAATVGTRVSPALVLAVIAVESAGQSDAVSRAGAQGLMQLMPDTATRFGVVTPLSATQNIKGGVAYLDWLMNHFDRDPILVIAAYNSGEGSVRDNAGVPPYPETRAYVPKVLAAWNVARGLCQTPPILMTDGCVFAVNGS